MGVVYNAARIQLSERAHELASLRVLGFTRAEVGYVLVGETMLLALLAVPVGWLAGYGFAALVAQGFSTDMVRIPLVITRSDLCDGLADRAWFRRWCRRFWYGAGWTRSIIVSALKERG